MSRDLLSLAVIATVAALAPLLVHRFRLVLPEIVLLLLGGVVCGPELLGWIQVSEPVELFNEVGLGMLFFIAGYEVNLRRMPRSALRLGGVGWLVSVVIACIVSVALAAAGIVTNAAAVAIALTSTALGTLLPLLDAKGLTSTGFGRLFFGTGFFGEFGPIVAISILLGTTTRFVSLITLAVFALFVVVVAVLPSRMASDPMRRALSNTSRTNSLTGVRLALLLLFVLLAISASFGLDAVLGAFAAGAVLRMYSPDRDEHLMIRIEAVGFGLFIPLFFVVTGATLDVGSIVTSPLAVVLFVLLLLAVRGLPQLLVYRHAIPDLRARGAFAFYSATGLPILIAVSTIAVAQDLMTSRSAAILIGAGVLTVVAFPITADALLRGRHPVLPDEELLTASLPEPEPGHDR